ncbi:MAG: M36 family metallopeptidase [Sphingobacteriales bacterium]|nr:M36 family metallopeptidase [Sphingobacteriales bacterium]
MVIIICLCANNALIAQKTTPTNQKTALEYLQNNRIKLGLDAADIAELHVVNAYTNRHNGVTQVYIRQGWHGYWLNDGHATISVLPDGKVLHVGNKLASQIANRVTNNFPDTFLPAHLQAAFKAVKLNYPDENAEIRIQANSNNNKTTNPKAFFVGFQQNLNILVEPVWASVPTLGNNSLLRPAFIIHLTQQQPQYHVWQIVVDAVDFNILSLHDAVNHCKVGSYCALTPLAKATTQQHACTEFEAAEQQGQKYDYNVWPYPLESPLHGPRAIKNSPWIEGNADASPYGWHDVNGDTDPEYDITRGNNVWAQDDEDGNNDDKGYSPKASDFVFDYAYNPEAKVPIDNIDAALTNLFYWNNLIHDIAYHYGFTEEAGNFQQNNYDKGGEGNDFVFADAMDGSTPYNANFYTPKDGEAPRMNMGLWYKDESGTVMRINTPKILEGKHNIAPAVYGPPLPITPKFLSGKLVLVDDGSATPTLGCATLINPDAIKDNIALIDMGNCEALDKSLNAQKAGAIAVLLCNDVEGDPVSPFGDDFGQAKIPTAMMAKTICDSIKLMMVAGETVSVDLKELTTITFDSDLDNGIIAHEYMHGISNRLTGGPLQVDCLNSGEQMGEGWSDFWGLALTTNSKNNGKQARGIGNFSDGQSLAGGGIRTYPYSTDMNINPITYDRIKESPEVHFVGEVWTAMLWDLYWALVDVYGFDEDIYQGKGGNNIAIQLVIDGLKLQPCKPGFVDGRDAILAADQANNNGANQCLIWQVFARRGLGFSANQGSSDNTTDGIQAFDLPPICQTLQITLPAPHTITAGTDITYQFTITNNSSTQTLNQVVATHNLANGLTYKAGSSTCGDPSVDGQNLIFPEQTLAPGASANCSFEVNSAPGNTSQIWFTDGAENGIGNFTNESTGGAWQATTGPDAHSGNNYFSANGSTESPTEAILTLNQPITLSGVLPVLRFWHWYNLASYVNGGIVEISADGSPWMNVSNNSFLRNAYQQVITNANSPLVGQLAFSGNSEGYILTEIDLSDYAGKTIQWRFRLGSDGETMPANWLIDDIELIDAYIYPAEICANSSENFSGCAQEHTVAHPFAVGIDNTNNSNNALNENESLKIQVKPNLVTKGQQIIIQTTSTQQINSQSQAAMLRIFDTMGKLYCEKPVIINQSNVIQLPSALPAGCLIFQVITSSQVAQQLVIVVNN